MARGSISPVSILEPITPNDSTVFDTPYRALWIGGAGNIKIDTPSSQDVVLVGVSTGFLPVNVVKVHATSTTAVSIVGAK